MKLTLTRRTVAQMAAALVGAIVMLALAACANTSGTSEPIDDNTTDQMWNTQASDCEIYVFQLGDQTIMASDYYYTVDISGSEPLEDGCFYKVVADINYLNGGVAGYVDYPEIKHVTSVEKVSPLDMDLPSLAEKKYGLLLIGDYAEGDVLFNERNTMAVWKDGGWLYRYDSRIDLEDGTIAGVAKGITAEDVQAGISAGTLCCKDYFALLPEIPATTKTQDDIPADSILLFDNDEGATKLKEAMDKGDLPTQCDALYDAMGSRPSVTVTDAETIKELYARLSQMTIGSATPMSVTDTYHHIYFTLADGTKVGWNFETEAILCRGKTNYEARDNGNLWGLVRELQEKRAAKQD